MIFAFRRFGSIRTKMLRRFAAGLFFLAWIPFFSDSSHLPVVAGEIAWTDADRAVLATLKDRSLRFAYSYTMSRHESSDGPAVGMLTPIFTPILTPIHKRLRNEFGLDRLFDGAIRLYPLLHSPLYPSLLPQGRQRWQKQEEHIAADHYLQDTDRQRTIQIGVFLLALIAAILFLLYYFIKYDWQIRQLLRRQTTIDFMWGSLRTGRLVSKGGFPLFREFGGPFLNNRCTLAEASAALGKDLASEYGAIMERMQRDGSEVAVNETSFLSPLDGSRRHYRRFLYRLTKNDFMVCFQDNTAEKNARNQEEFLNQLFDCFKDGLIFIDRNMKLLRYNRAVEKIFPNVVISKLHCYESLKCKDHSCDRCPVRETLGRVDTITIGEQGKCLGKIGHCKMIEKYFNTPQHPVFYFGFCQILVSVNRP